MVFTLSCFTGVDVNCDKSFCFIDTYITATRKNDLTFKDRIDLLRQPELLEYWLWLIVKLEFLDVYIRELGDLLFDVVLGSFIINNNLIDIIS